jgi:nitrite reductase/ring-hydroxylating ferredoxin subunit
MGEFVKAASTSEIAPGQARLVTVKGREIVLFNIEGAFFALANACTHEEGPLAEGEAQVSGHEVTGRGMAGNHRTGDGLGARPRAGSSSNSRSVRNPSTPSPYNLLTSRETTKRRYSLTAATHKLL